MHTIFEHPLVQKALAIATAAHEGQVRKTDKTPYINHPIAVARMLAGQGFGEIIVAAALAHDVVEDTDVSEETLRSELGDEVTDIVKAVSEDKELPWEARKEAYAESVRRGSDAVKAVSIADKIHNAQSIIASHKTMGNSIWESFNRDKETKLRNEEHMLAVFKKSWQHPLINEYESAISQMRMLD